MSGVQKLSITSAVLAVSNYHQAVDDWPPALRAGVSSGRSRSPGARGRRKKAKAQKVARRLNR